MAVRFSKLKTVNLEDDDQEELEPIVGEEPRENGDGEEWDSNANDHRGEMDDEGKTMLIMNEDETEVKRGKVPWWMCWSSRRSYSPLKQRRLRKCPCNSWKVIATAVLIFSVVFFISLIISTVVPEPSESEGNNSSTLVPESSEGERFNLSKVTVSPLSLFSFPPSSSPIPSV